MKKEFSSFEEMESFAGPLLDEGCWYVVILELKDKNGYSVEWHPKKFYTAQDGKTYDDEVWITESGEMKFVQDLEPEHVRNILRRILRKEREFRKSLNQLIGALAEEESMMPDDIMDIPEPQSRTLH